MPPVNWHELVRRLKVAGFDAPHSGGKHPIVPKGIITVAIPNPHRAETGPELILRVVRAGAQPTCSLIPGNSLAERIVGRMGERSGRLTMASLLGTGLAAVLLVGCAGGGLEDPTGIVGQSGQFEYFEIAFAGNAYKRYVPGDTLLVSFAVTGGESVSIWVTRPDGVSVSIYSRGLDTTPQFTGVAGYSIPDLTGVYTVEGEVTGANGSDSGSAQVEVVSGASLGTVEVTFLGAPGAVSYEVGLAPGGIDILTPKNPYKLMGLVPGVYTLGVAAFTSIPPFGLISTREVPVTVVGGETTSVTVDFADGKSRQHKGEGGLSRWRFRSAQERRSVSVPPVQ